MTIQQHLRPLGCSQTNIDNYALSIKVNWSPNPQNHTVMDLIPKF